MACVGRWKRGAISQKSLRDSPELPPHAFRIYRRANDNGSVLLVYKRYAGFGDSALQAAFSEPAK